MSDDRPRACPRPLLPELFPPTRWAAIGATLALTRRQLEVVRWICRGQSTVGTATCMGISPNTVRMHLRCVYDRLGVRDRAGVILLVIHAERRLDDEPRDSAHGP